MTKVIRDNDTIRLTEIAKKAANFNDQYSLYFDNFDKKFPIVSSEKVNDIMRLVEGRGYIVTEGLILLAIAFNRNRSISKIVSFLESYCAIEDTIRYIPEDDKEFNF